jgi:hypothetical protein
MTLVLRAARSSLMVLMVAAAGCGEDSDPAAVDGDDGSEDDGDGAAIADECNPLGGATCLMPWPSSAYLEEDSSTATGFRVGLPDEAMPTNVDNIAVDPAPWNRFDGFSPSGAILAEFESGVSAEGLPSHTDPAASLAADSPVVVLNMDTGDRALVFAEVDMNVADATQRALIIRPLERLAGGARYAVGIRRGVRAADGKPLERPAGFQSLLDGDELDHPRFARLAERSEDVLSALEADGVPRDDLVLAWDFVTASDESMTADLMAMREQALPVMGEAGANLTFTAEQLDGGDPALVHRLLTGTHDAPNFLTNGEEDDSLLRRGADGAGGPGHPGQPELGGTYPANFTAIIPRCVRNRPLPIPALLFGHGLFGTGQSYAENDLLQGVANDNCVVILAGDWIGLTDRQLPSAVVSANDLNRSHAMVEKLAQSVINFIALEQIVRGPMADAPEFRLGNRRIIDPERVYFFGASLGGIMGGTFMAYDPFIERGALGVPGAAWSLLIERSYAWNALSLAANSSYLDRRESQILIALLTWSMERWDPITTAPRVLDDPLPGTPPKQLLLYEGVNDCLVSNLSSEMLARTLGVPVTEPSVKVPYGLEGATEPVPSGFTIYDEKREPAVPETNVPPAEDNGTHSGVNENPAVLRQVIGFVLDGEVVHECRDAAGDPAPCDCTTGACE